MAKTLTDIGIQKIGSGSSTPSITQPYLERTAEDGAALPKNRQRLRREGVCLLR